MGLGQVAKVFCILLNVIQIGCGKRKATMRLAKKGDKLTSAVVLLKHLLSGNVKNFKNINLLIRK